MDVDHLKQLDDGFNEIEETHNAVRQTNSILHYFIGML